MSTSRSKKPRLNASCYLKIKEIEKFQFQDEYFEVMVWLQDEQERMMTDGLDVPLDVSLVYEDGNVVSSDLMADVDPITPAVIKNGRASIRVKINDLSMNHGNRKFCLLVSVKGNSPSVLPVRSDPTSVIKHRLIIKPDVIWEEEWFKDEGGRDKCIEIGLELKDSKNNLVNRKVPLLATLLYQNGIEVSRQDILKIGPESDLFIINGKARIRFRIDEVSRSHQNQAFTIKIAPDISTDPLFNDISPVVSEKVIVRSKRNNKKRKESAAIAAATAAATSLSRHHSNGTPFQHSYDSIAPISSNGVESSSVMSRSFTPRTEHQPNISRNTDLGSNFHQALLNTLGWISEVLKTIQKIKWQPLGIEQYPPNILPPPKGPNLLYHMENPNSSIDQILDRYKSVVMDDLHLILNTLEPMLQSTSSEQQEDSGIGNTADEDMPPPMPSLVQRQQSSAYIGETENTASVPYVNTYTGSVAVQESSVQYIIAKVVVTKNVKLGFPVFNSGKQLLGFYKESDQVDADTMQLSFVPLAHAKASAKLMKENVDSAADSLERGIQGNSESVFRRSDFPNLQQMKESAWIRYMNKVTADDSFELDVNFFDL